MLPDLPAPSRHGTRRLTDIDVLRGIAIALVALAHVPGNLIWPPQAWLAPFSSILAVGVEIFFTISGFVIGRSLLPDMKNGAATGTRWPTIRRFWLRRAWRLLPSAYLWLLVTCVLSVAFNKAGWFDAPEATLRAAGASVLDLANVLLSYRFQHGLYPGPLFHYWSLSLEEQFYFVVPFVVLLPRRQLAGLMILAVPTLCALAGPYMGTFRAENLVCGLLLALLERSGRWPWRHRLPAGTVRRLFPLLSCATLWGILELCRIEPSPVMGWSLNFWLARLGVAGASVLLVLFASADCGLLVGRGRLYLTLLGLGRRSYSVYLVHICAFTSAKEIIWRLGFRDGASGLGGLSVIVIGVALLAAFTEATYRLVETRVWHKPDAPVQPPAETAALARPAD